MSERTIAAISTAVSTSGIGIVRVSGPDALHVVAKVYRSKSGKKDIRLVPTHTIHYGYIMKDGSVCDEVLVMVMRGPHTYTGEDTVEIDCHGGVLSMRRVLEAVLEAGAVTAEPGEFTKKAFFHGRIDLSQAEAVMDVIASTNEMALQNSLGQLKGNLKQDIEQMRRVILYEVATIEASLDDPEHLSLDGYSESLRPKIMDLSQHVDKLIKSFHDGRFVKEGIRTAIIGKPNVGKSSLLNLLLGQERAIVTEVAGTTRDVLEDTLTFGGITLRIMDTAGIRSTEDLVEKIGVRKAKEIAEKCDLILYVVDSSVPLDENDREILELIENKKAIIIYNKTDLTPVFDLSALDTFARHKVIPLSTKEGHGLEELEEEIKEMFFSGMVASKEEILVTNVRHKELLREAQQSLSKVLESISLCMSEDFLTIDLMDAYESLGKILGESLEEDLVDEIFAKFCVGK